MSCRPLSELGRFAGPVRPYADEDGCVDLDEPAAAAAWRAAERNLAAWRGQQGASKPAAERRTCKVLLSFTAAELDALDAAVPEGMTRGRWAREALLRHTL